uniref:Uncharacterized protein n=1 Tax=Timema cristinae TaxID=61476 RepID=A0A7R9H472_TIMCR|nr:unnamed protein product [Timema cristinae]
MLSQKVVHLSSSSSASSSSPPLYTCPSISSSSSSSPAISAFSASARSICLASSASSVAVTTLGCINRLSYLVEINYATHSVLAPLGARTQRTLNVSLIPPGMEVQRSDDPQEVNKQQCCEHAQQHWSKALIMIRNLQNSLFEEIISRGFLFVFLLKFPSRPLVEIFQLLVILVVQEFRHMAQDGVDSLCFGKPLCALLHILSGHSSLAQRALTQWKLLDLLSCQLTQTSKQNNADRRPKTQIN